MNNQELRIKLLEMQIEALRAVLSEWDHEKDGFTEWHKAEAIAELLNHIKYGE